MFVVAFTLFYCSILIYFTCADGFTITDYSQSLLVDDLPSRVLPVNTSFTPDCDLFVNVAYFSFVF